MKFIIDGYNVIHKIEQLKDKRLRSQRDGLITMLENAQAQSKRLRDITLVFDGKQGIVAPRIDSTVKVVFSKGICADKKIKKMVESSHFARDIGVVSDDRQVRFYVGTLGAKKISVQEFLKMLWAPAKREETFKLSFKEADEINRELEKIWLE